MLLALQPVWVTGSHERAVGDFSAIPLQRWRDSYGIGYFPANGPKAMNWLLVAALAVAGFVIGWCLRAVVVRLSVPAGEPLRTGCPQCGQPIMPARMAPTPGQSGDVPVAGHWQRLASFSAGRCPACSVRAGPPPLGVELPTAILFGALAARVHPGLVLAAACWLAACAVALGWIDAAVQRLPDLLTAPAYAGTAALLLAAAGAGEHWGSLLRAFLGGLALAAAYLLLTLASRAAVGLGDAKLAASLGTLLAWPGWPTLLAGTFTGFLLAAIYGLALLVARRITFTQRIPFGPFMIAGAYLALLADAPH
jgi:leader peptidase (prepilin peptidase) / N-methyltransferase